MNLHHGDCLDVMAAMEPESVDSIVCDPPYGLEFMGKEWDKLGAGISDSTKGTNAFELQRKGNLPFGGGGKRVNYGTNAVTMQAWHQQWAEAAYRVAKPSSYLLAFGGTRTVHRMTCALEDAGWIIRDMLVWGYASGFPKSKASLKPAWEPIVMARKPGPLRMLAIDACRIPMTADDAATIDAKHAGMDVLGYERPAGTSLHLSTDPMPLKAAAAHEAGRWPANIILTDEIFDGGIEGVVGGGETGVSAGGHGLATQMAGAGTSYGWQRGKDWQGAGGYGDSGTYSRFFLIAKSSRSDREPVIGMGGEANSGGRANVHPTPSSPSTSCATSCGS